MSILAGSALSQAIKFRLPPLEAFGRFALVSVSFLWRDLLVVTLVGF
jgi:hypothetical protein